MKKTNQSAAPYRRPHGLRATDELGWWLWYLIVLPSDEARPWPLWLKYLARGAVIRLARLLDVPKPESLHSWICWLVLRSPQPGGGGERARLHHPGMVLRLVSEIAAPFSNLLGTAVGRGLDQYSALVGAAWAGANRSLRHFVVASILLLLAIVATTPLELLPQIEIGVLMLFASLLIRRIPRAVVAPVLVTLSLIASARVPGRYVVPAIEVPVRFHWSH